MGAEEIFSYGQNKAYDASNGVYCIICLQAVEGVWRGFPDKVLDEGKH